MPYAVLHCTSCQEFDKRRLTRLEDMDLDGIRKRHHSLKSSSFTCIPPSLDLSITEQKMIVNYNIPNITDVITFLVTHTINQILHNRTKINRKESIIQIDLQ